MSRSRQSSGFHRREQEAREAARRRLIFIGVGAVLLVVAGIVAAGVILTVVLPPRAHVLTVGSREFNAQQVADHARYLAFFVDPEVRSAPATEAIASLVRQEAMVQGGEPVVGPITDEDLRAGLMRRLGLPEDASDQAFADAYRRFLQVIPLSRAEYERLTRAGLIRERLLEQYEADLPQDMEQLQLLYVNLADRTRAAAYRQALLDGQDYLEAAELHGVARSRLSDLEWHVAETLPEEVREAILALEVGGVTELIDDAVGIGVDLYYLADRKEGPLEEGVKELVASQRLSDFVESQRSALGVRADLTDSVRRWIADRVEAP